MLIHEEKNFGSYFIKSYVPGAITVNDVVYTKSILIINDQLIENWVPQTIEQLKSSDFEPCLKQGLEVVLLGTGEKQHFPPTATFSLLIDANLGFELMDTAAACRTYNILAAEGRKVAAALLIK